jgi:hypothetical protein
VAVAGELLAEGVNVVLVADPACGEVVLPAPGPGRLAVLVGSLDDPVVAAAAAAMGSELFGAA